MHYACSGVKKIQSIAPPLSDMNLLSPHDTRKSSRGRDFKLQREKAILQTHAGVLMTRLPETDRPHSNEKWPICCTTSEF